MFNLNILEMSLTDIFLSHKKKYFYFKNDSEIEYFYNYCKKKNYKYFIGKNYKKDEKINEKGYVFKIQWYDEIFRIRIYGISQLTINPNFKVNNIIFFNKEEQEKTIEKNEIKIKINNQYALLKKQLEQKIRIADLQTQDILHYLENCNPSGKEMLKLCSKLKTIRKERRLVKQEIDIVNKIECEVYYSYRTDIISETL